MNTAITDDMVSAMDETADFMHQQPPFVFPPSGIKHEPAPKVVRLKGLQPIVRHGITVTGQAQGQADADRRDALRRGGR